VTRTRSLVLGLTLLALLPEAAAAMYLDPAVRSMLLQGLVALILALITTVGMYWRSTKAAVRRFLDRRDRRIDR
jgi:hypothetical protein